MCACFFFFKQKTAYEMRISDWSSDVCSSDLAANGTFGLLVDSVSDILSIPHRELQPVPETDMAADYRFLRALVARDERMVSIIDLDRLVNADAATAMAAITAGQGRSEERRGGTECVSTSRSRWAQYPSQQHTTNPHTHSNHTHTKPK